MSVDKDQDFSTGLGIDPEIVKQSYELDSAAGRPAGETIQTYMMLRGMGVLMEAATKWLSETRIAKRIASRPSR
ncbi:hypothetical protein HY440_01660 [Candidatus Microgenomates bacterium]|nr:hypothetical protein [Candidatus Microgenomates bacterium]